MHIDECTTVAGGTFSKSYTTYTIRVVRPEALGGTTTVARRYSEFEKTWSALSRFFSGAGLVLPPMPTHDAAMTPDKNKRMRSLALMLGAAHRNAFVRFHPLYINFINPDGSGPGNGDGAFIAAEKSGEFRWEEFLPTLPADLDGLSEDALEKKCMDLSSESAKVEKEVAAVAKAWEASLKVMAAQAKAASDLEAAVGKWADSEASCGMLNDTAAWPHPGLATAEVPPPRHSA